MKTLLMKLAAVIEGSRPLLWLFSVTSSFCGMFMAAKGLPPIHILIFVGIGVGPCLTSATNLLNGVSDIEIDKISKPNRPLPTNRISKTFSLILASILYSIGLAIASTMGYWPFILTLVGVVVSVTYSIPPLRFKSRGGLSNFLVALGYTTICFLGAWSIFRNIQDFPWPILLFVTFQVTGANTVKDFVDYEADKEFEIGTLPVKYGVSRTIALISPLFAGIYVSIPLLYAFGRLGMTFLPITFLMLWGVYILYSLIRNFSRKNREKAFLQALLMSMLTEIAFAWAYILS